MRLTLVAALICGTAFGGSAFGREIGEVSDEQSFGDRSINLMLSLPSGVAAEMKVRDDLLVGFFAEGSLGGVRPGGGGRRGPPADGDEEQDRTEVSSRISGLQAHWCPNGQVFSDHYYLSPFLGYVTATMKSSATEYSTKGSGISVGAIGGYGWFWSSGFNFGIGFGVKHTSLTVGERSYLGKDGTIKELSVTGLQGFSPTGELTLGFAF
jgi:hypothetical protein